MNNFSKHLEARILSWIENGVQQSREWVSEAQFSPPKSLMIGDDRLKADDFYRNASQGAGYIYRGDFHNAKQLLQAVQRRLDKNANAKFRNFDEKSPLERFLIYRQVQSHKAQILSRLFVCIEQDSSILLGRAPHLQDAIRVIHGDAHPPFVVSLRELLGYVGAHEWRKRGIEIPALKAKIFPHYGVFAPIRNEYLDLIETTPLPERVDLAFDIGTGTGVLAAMLVRKGVQKVIATDINSRALACASENIEKLGMREQITLVQTHLFPEGIADFIVCNPPWLPVRPSSRLEEAVFDQDHRMLKWFLENLSRSLSQEGEAWLIISDLAEHLGLRDPKDLENWIEKAQLKVIERIAAKAQHAKAKDPDGPLFFARSKETTFLWRLKNQS